MREEYPDLEADPIEEVVDDRFVSGYDVQFFALDLLEHSPHPLLSHARSHDPRLRAMDGPSSRPKSPTFADAIIRSIEETED